MYPRHRSVRISLAVSNNKEIPGRCAFILISFRSQPAIAVSSVGSFAKFLLLRLYSLYTKTLSSRLCRLIPTSSFCPRSWRYRLLSYIYFLHPPETNPLCWTILRVQIKYQNFARSALISTYQANVFSYSARNYFIRSSQRES